ncbi:MAG TPA: hypothetical protein VMA74_02590 [Dyella sp.]|uniref:hypothetical protein n=1 Tax=Dyella sp. TaxID=1869338 RepID=UPI002CA123A9|nr:hypothetical protein [Dyella sp.]HUB88596.1 hypothetical protein [Dyella sp.]
MATRSRGFLAGFGWLKRGIGVGIRHPKPALGGAALLMLAVLGSTLITLPMQFYELHSGTPPSMAAFGGIMLVSVLIGLLVLPLYAGYLQMIAAAETGLSARAGDIIKPYREGKVLRLIGYGIVMLLVYVALFAAVIALTGGGIAHWYMQVLTAQLNHQLPPTTLPDGFGITMLLIFVFGIFMMGFYSIGLGQVTLHDRGVFGAVGDGVIGALKNLLPLLMLAVCLVLTWIAASICIGIVALVIVMVGKLISQWLVLALITPLYIAVLLVVFAAMFGVMYHLWRDVCGDDIAMSGAEAIAA